MNDPVAKSVLNETTRVEEVGTQPDGSGVPAVTAAAVERKYGDFEIISKLGEGAFGQVFLARQVSLGREVALKVEHVTDGESMLATVATSGRSDTAARNEGQLLASLEHDHIVKVFSEFRDRESRARGLCLQYVPGADLGAVIRRVHAHGSPPKTGRAILDALDASRRGEAGFDPSSLRDRDALGGDDFAQSVCRLGARLAEALAFAHARGVLHCDIKPANILLTQYGRPMLADFNVAFDLSRHQGSAGGIGGTLAYMAPEHRAAVMGLVWGTVDERCDIFSLGVVLCELATGRRPAIPKPGEPVVACDDSAMEKLPRELAAILRRCMEREATERYQTAGELAEALTAAWQLLAARRALPPAGRIGRWTIANPVTAIVLAAALPHLIASIVNISYNSVHIHLESQRQKQVFLYLILGYNLLAYPACMGIAVALCVQVKRRFVRLSRARGQEVDDLRRRVRQLGWWTIVLGSIGWFPGGILFPLVIDLASGPIGWEIYAHYLVSFALAGLIGVVFTYLGIEYVCFRALFPRLGNPDAFTPAKMWAELQPLTVPFVSFLVLACAVPLVGAALLILFADGGMSLGFRILVAALIGVGVAGVSVAERLTRKLRQLAAVWHRETRETA
ncbi:MAG TPA: serine/threonine-protein kinase [Gemmata sp.]|nr:serine/threonine-protein kinase [Gemmata sp.]